MSFVLPLAVNRITCVNALGSGFAATADAVAAARSGLALNDFTDDPLPTWIGRVRGVETRPVLASLAAHDCRNNRLAQWALQQDGFEDAVAALRERYGATRIGVFLGTSTSGILETELGYRARGSTDAPLPTDVRMRACQNVFSAADFVRAYLKLRGPASAVSTACSSSLKAFAQAARFIAAGWCDAAVVGGVDSLCYTTLYGFQSLQLLSPDPCRPCAAERNGISIGEGAGFALLERRAPESGELALLGHGESSDAHHMSSPDPDGTGAECAMRAALASAGINPDAIDYVAMHG
ncbi:MAG: beta-ketoacyl synthase N-terminal-like domain-containing protein, partial [Burkholderiales bacterium]